MDFVPVYEEQAASRIGGIPGYAPVTVSEEGLRLAGIRTTPAIRGVLNRTIRTVGLVQSDERRVHQVTLKSAGYIERLFVGTTGQLVHEGDPILSIYSPDLLSAQSEYLRARKTAQDLQASGMEEVRRGAEDLLELVEEKARAARCAGRPDPDDRAHGHAGARVDLHGPVSGYVTARPVVAGMLVEPGTELFTVTDLSKVWIEADFYEYEAIVPEDRPGGEPHPSL